MNTLELKSGMIEMITQVKDQELLQHLYELVSATLSQNSAPRTLMSPDLEAQLDEDLKAIENPENLIDHEEVLKIMSKWRSPSA